MIYVARTIFSHNATGSQKVRVSRVSKQKRRDNFKKKESDVIRDGVLVRITL